ncbi:MAG TPA: FliM/FliN family flagellar motor C-terminal domain-containing protein [Anaerohalosphaeraceae bacterium]|nr:FliM/FliN family flagellar motor C-terminal domain-containing protein [Anaerohalosphaeraceae bacterium]HOT72452.1 FliM/FliN family flagellar motor C-terminal domain-containing protein [Anaerohalosphaeraceae bacterium]HPB92599.1 FliM/FliN family flagellar motor C-terminal domain-containing protein [Anaerohalosphaeraceae bacterium]HQG05959.1 FliM/FliN family flagellar motor C-terminal domain-containing protein [Anaerohalosphaeraceae bacterium]HQI07241.1 FliM/FliN family flagellar motor C-termi
MSREETRFSLTREKLQRLVERARQTEAMQPEPEAKEFDWTCPHRFGAEARSHLEALGNRMALSVQKGLNEHSNGSIESSLKAVREHFAYRLAQTVSVGQEGPYVIGLRDESKQCIGCLLFTFENARFLVAQMLNDPEAAVGQNGTFSALEESILMDTSAVLTGFLSDVLEEQLQLKIQPNGQLVRGDWVMRSRILEDLCEWTFGIQYSVQQVEFSIVLESALLDAYAGVSMPAAVPPSQCSARILERLRQVPVSVCATLDTAVVGLGDLAQVEAGDVLLFGQKIRRPLQVLLNGRPCFYAYPAQQQGKLALVIAEPESE